MELWNIVWEKNGAIISLNTDGQKTALETNVRFILRSRKLTPGDLFLS